MDGRLNGLDEQRVQRLIDDLAERVRSDIPGWAEQIPGDPGVTMLELFAFLAETLLSRAERIPALTTAALRATIARLVRLQGRQPTVLVAVDDEPWRQVAAFPGTSPTDSVFVVDQDGDGDFAVRFGDGVEGRRPPQGSSVTVNSYRVLDGADMTVVSTWPFQACASAEVTWTSDAIRFHRPRQLATLPIHRVRYFSGQLLSVTDLRDEQNYFRDKFKRHNRYLHGAGVVHGLAVTLSSYDVTIGAGYALDASGNEIALPVATTIPLPRNGDAAYVALRYTEREALPVDAAAGDHLEPSRIEEGCDILLEQTPDTCGIAVARIVKDGSNWIIDTGYSPPLIGEWRG